jgi:benzoate-CoA ligase
MGAYNAAAWLLDRHLERGDGERVALRCRGESVTYADLSKQVWRVQHIAADLGLREEDRVLLVVNDEPGFVAWFLGCLRSGLIPVPLSTMATAADLAAISRDASPRAVVGSDEYRDRLPAAEHQLIIGEEPASDDAEAKVADTTGDSAAFWLYSSGTTGTPKGVMHRHAGPQATADTYAAEVLGIQPDDRCLSVAKLFFAYGLGNSLTFPFSVGATAILNPARPTPNDVVDLIKAEQASLFFASPGFVAGLLDADIPPEALGSVRLTVTAGESLPADLQRRFSDRFGHPVLDGIGTTEALHIFLSNRAGDVRPGTSGRPVNGYDLQLLDDNGTQVDAAETPGYLHVRGPSIARGYWQRDEATTAAFSGGWLRTGDVYTRSADGYWTFLGRNNDMIKAGGIWVSPAEVEAVLVEHPDVLEAAVVGGRDEAGLEQTVAFLVPRAGRGIDPAKIDEHCRGRMAAFKRPKRLEVVDALPKTATGKIQRFALRDRLTR